MANSNLNQSTDIALAIPIRPYFLIACTTLLVQIFLISLSFPLAQLWTDKPILYRDSACHWYTMKMIVNMAKTGNINGYDPFFAAGYLGGLGFDSSAKVPALLAVIFNTWLCEARVYKFYVFISGILGPVCVPIAMRLLKLNVRTSIIASIFGVILWWASAFRWYHTLGMVSFVMISYITLPYLALLFRYINNFGDWKTLLILGASGSFCFFYHPHFAVLAAFFSSACIMVNKDDVSKKRVLAVTLALPILCLIPNLWWLCQTMSSGMMFKSMPYQTYRYIDMIWRELLGIWGNGMRGSKIYAPIAFAAAWSCLRAGNIYIRKISYTFAATGILLILFAVVGSTLPCKGLFASNRFSPTGYLMLSIPAALGVIDMFRASIERRNAMIRLCARAGIFFVAAAVLFNFNEIRREVSYADIRHYGIHPPEVNGIGDYSEWVLNWLTRETTNSGRVLFEDLVDTTYEKVVMSGYYAYNTNREFIGGPYPFWHFAGFWDGFLFNKLIWQISHEDFKKYMDLYNIGWIIVYSNISKHYLDKMPDAMPVGEYKHLKVYKFERPLSYFIEGSGEVLARGHNKLVLTNLSGDAIVLKYHFVPGLKSKPAATIIPIKIMDDPTPFIKILKPPKKILLYL